MKKQRLNILLLVIASFIVLYFVLKDDFENVVNLISNINFGWFLFSVLIVLIYWLFQALSLSAVLKSGKNKLPFWILYKSMIMCNFFSAITPSATGGQPFQIYYLKKNGLRLGTASNLVIEQSTLYQIALVLMGLVAIVLNYFFDFFPSNSILKKLVLVGFTINVIVIFLLIFITINKKLSRYIILKIVKFLKKIKIIRDVDKMKLKVERFIENFYTSAKSLNSNKKALLKGIIFNFIALTLLYIVPLPVAYSIGDYTSLNVITTLVASAYVMLIGVFVPIPGGSGGVEYAFVSFFGFYLTGSHLMALLLIWRFITYYFSILIGGLVLIFNKGGAKKCE